MILLSNDFLITVLDKTVQERTEGIYNASLNLRTLLLQEVNYMKFIIPDTSRFINIIIDNIDMYDIIRQSIDLNLFKNNLTLKLYENIDKYIKLLFQNNEIENYICEMIECFKSDKYNILEESGINNKKEILSFLNDSFNYIMDYHNDLLYLLINIDYKYIIISSSYGTDEIYNYLKIDYIDNSDDDLYYDFYGHFYDAIILNYIYYKADFPLELFIYEIKNFNFLNVFDKSALIKICSNN